MSDNSAGPVFEKPFVLAMGPQRTGTGWLERVLRARGDVCLPRDVKEIFFFDRHYQRGPEFYKSHFHVQDKHKIVMELSTTAFDHMDAPERVKNLFGTDLTLICPLRHPVERSYSLYRHFLRYGIVSGSLADAVEQTPQILFSSRYADHLERWFESFGADKVHVLINEDLETDPEAFLRELYRIIALDYQPAPEELQGHYNVGTAAPSPVLARAAQKTAQWLRDRKMYGVLNLAKATGIKRLCFGANGKKRSRDVMSAEERSWLNERLLREIEKCETLLGRKIPQWHD